MARAPIGSLTDLASEVLREVDEDAAVKTAERAIVRAVAAEPKTEVGQLLRKAAEAVRQDDEAVSYGDLHNFLRAGGARG